MKEFKQKPDRQREGQVFRLERPAGARVCWRESRAQSTWGRELSEMGEKGNPGPMRRTFPCRYGELLRLLIRRGTGRDLCFAKFALAAVGRVDLREDMLETGSSSNGEDR